MNSKSTANSKYVKALQISVVSFVVVFICFIPYLQAGIVYGSDQPYHLMRIYSLANSIQNGIFPVKVHALSCYGYGYASGFFYSDALLYFPAILIISGCSLTTAYKIFAFLLLSLNYAAMLFSVKRITNKWSGAVFAASLYISGTSVIQSLYVDFAIGSICGSIFMIIAIAGMYLFLARDESPLTLILGFTGLFYTHTISAILTFTVCVLILLFHINYIKCKPYKLIQLIFSVILVLTISASYWLPMLEQMKAQRLKYLTPWTTESDNISNLHAALFGTRGIGLFIFGALVFCFFTSLFLISRSLQKKKSLTENLYCISVFTFLGGIYCFLPMLATPWQLLNSHGMTLIQFPYRLYFPAAILVAFAFGCAVSEIKLQPYNHKLMLVIYICIMIINISYDYYLFRDNIAQFASCTEDVENGNVSGAGAGEEWLPLEVDLNTLKERSPLLAINNNGVPVTGQKLNGYTRYRFSADLSGDYYDVPYIWYKGYAAYSDDGTKYEVTYNAQTKLVRIIMPHDQYSIKTITVYYKGTKYQKMAYAISIAGITILVLWFCFLRKRSFRMFINKKE